MTMNGEKAEENHMRKTGRKKVLLAAAVLGAVMAAALPASAALAAGPGEPAAEAAPSVLDDRVLEYGELADAVKEGNPTMLAALKSYSDRIDTYQRARMN